MPIGKPVRMPKEYENILSNQPTVNYDEYYELKEENARLKELNREMVEAFKQLEALKGKRYKGVVSNKSASEGGVVMREIKFRFWLNNNLQGYKKLTIGGIIDVPYEWNNVDQFTGLLDKNGKEIYEGDIVEIPDHWDSTVPLVELVKYIEATFMPFSDSDWGCDSDECKVIGNIYEDGEMICQKE